MAGWLDIVLGAAPAVANLFGGAAKGRAEGRKSEADTLLEQERNKLYGYNTQQGATTTALSNEEQGKLARAALDLERRKFAQSAPTTRARQAALGDLLANTQDVTLSGLSGRIKPMQFSGGLRPSALGPNARAAGTELSRQALMAQLAGDSFEDVAPTDFRSGILKPPSSAQLPQAGFLDKLLNTGAAVAGGLGALNSVMHPSDFVDWKGSVPTVEGKPIYVAPKNTQKVT